MALDRFGARNPGVLIEAYLIGGAAVVLYNHILLWQCARAAMRSLLIRWVVPLCVDYGFTQSGW